METIQSSKSKDFLVGVGLCQAIVCTSMRDKTAITTRINQECPTGFGSRWSLKKGKRNPMPCLEVKGNSHYLFEC